jgi:hypothetical protein
MKKRITSLVMAFALASLIGGAVPAAAANLHEAHEGTVCYGTVCDWHFVNNQTGGDSDITLDAVVTNATGVTILGTKVLRNVVHWWVRTTGSSPQTLETASSNNAGKLVLSDYACVCGCGCR